MTAKKEAVIIGKEINESHRAKEVKTMSTVKVGENENVESALRRFKRKCSRDGIIGDLRKKEFYEKPSVRRKKKSEAARKRSKN